MISSVESFWVRYSVCMYWFVCESVHVCVCLSDCMCRHIGLSLCLSVSLSECLSVCMSQCLCVFLCSEASCVKFSDFVVNHVGLLVEGPSTFILASLQAVIVLHFPVVH